MESDRVRLCKGAYKEPPELAYPLKDVDANYDHLRKTDASKDKGVLMDPVMDFPAYPAIAPHDPARINLAVYATRSVSQTGD
jgi:proline dehydrogenase